MFHVEQGLMFHVEHRGHFRGTRGQRARARFPIEASRLSRVEELHDRARTSRALRTLNRARDLPASNAPLTIAISPLQMAIRNARFGTAHAVLIASQIARDYHAARRAWRA